ncbi:MAG: M15 family metallopeptidase [Oscillospiraceae bacterium]|nr:M15 family metallopeptidase [Oscillospiraceae bacterium]
MFFRRLFRAGMCTLCALIFVLNSRGPQQAAAEGAEEPPAASPPSAAALSDAYRRLSAGKPELAADEWPLQLYGSGRPVKEEPAETVRVGGVPVDARIADELRAMIADARGAGLSVYLSCGYTDAAAQEHIFRRTAAKYGSETAQTIVGLPGESEHRSGLAVDIADRYYAEKDSSLENTKLFAWLKEHSWEYGFILRYPKDRKSITGHVYQPWHFRYVGAEAAAFMTDHGLTLEEFLDLYKTGDGGVY